MRVYPDDIELLCVYGAALGDAGLYDKARETFEWALQIDPNNAKTLNLYGMLFAITEQYEAALEKFIQASRQNPCNANILTNWGTTLSKLGRPEEALEQYERALLYKPEDPRILNFYGFILGSIGQHKQAIKYYERALKAQPENVDILNNYGTALEKIGEDDKAIIQYKKALQKAPDDSKILNNYGFVLAKLGRYDEAIWYYERASAIKPDDIDILHNWGAVLGNSGQDEAAIEKYKQSREINPNNIRLLADYSAILGMSGQYEAALEIIENALQIDPDNSEILSVYGIILNALGQQSVAIKNFERAIQRKPDDAEILTRYAVVLESVERTSEAFEKIEHALAVGVTDPYSSLICASFLEQQGKFGDALSILETINPRVLRPFYIMSLYLDLGRLYYTTGSESQGDEYFNLALENCLNQNDTRIEMVRRFLALKKASKEYIDLLQQMPKHSSIYNQALGLLSLGQSSRSEPTQNLYDFLGQIELLREVVERQQAELISHVKPVVYVEGPTDEIILNTAWQKLYGTMVMPYTIKNCDLLPANSVESAAGVGTLIKLISAVPPDNPHVVLGVLDRDYEGIKGFQGLPPNYFETINAIDAKVAKNRKSAIFLLPIPSNKERYAECQNLCIEFFFSESALIQRTSEGWGLEFCYPEIETKVKRHGNPVIKIEESTLPETREIKKGKMIFAKEIIPEFEVSEFAPFRIIFDKIACVLNYLQEKN